MLQSFEDVGETARAGERVAALRQQLRAMGLDGLIVPHADEFQGEYLAAYAERLAWLTGFTGSAGTGVVLIDKAAVFVDGRYTVQVVEQTDPALFATFNIADKTAADWLAETAGDGQRIGYDPWLMTAAEVAKFEKAVSALGGELVAVEENPIDIVWRDQPAPPAGAVEAHRLEFAGRSAADKLKEIGQAVNKAGAEACVLTLCDSICWLFNIRGHDVAHNPVVHAYAVVSAQAGTAQLFVDPARVDAAATAALEGVCELRQRGDFTAALEELGQRGARVLVDAKSAPAAVGDILTAAGAKVIDRRDPCILPKAIKNPVEQEGARAAHRRDAVAMVRFLAWLDEMAAAGEVDEIAAARRLEAFRADTGKLRDLSFDTISAAGPHAAIPHYRVTTASNRRLKPGDIYLVDSGGQYADGTTDVTRTVIVGEPGPDMVRFNTLVLKGMIALTRTRFPAGTTGGNLDVIARHALWQAGVDFDHGTGHGVGSYLSVHEGPQRFSKADATVLKPGMIMSNEPGYYRPGAFGIRIENLVVVREGEAINGGERDMLWFETLTLVPIDRRLIDADLLSEEEMTWFNAYHARVLAEIGPLIDEEATHEWLARACRPLAR